MKPVLGSAALFFLLAAPAFAQPPAAAPAGVTGLCKDGTYWTGKLKLGACHGHKGVQTWYGASMLPSRPVASMPPAGSAPRAAAMAQATGGGAGQVWVNSRSKVYHCPTDPYYGKTKQGQYMTEAAAIAAGDHADHGKACH